jgi:hypothetical protein
VNHSTPQIAEVNRQDPTPIMKGTFSVYDTPDGGYHIAYKLEGETDTNHAEIPGAALKMAATLSGSKNPFAMIGKMMGR